MKAADSCTNDAPRAPAWQAPRVGPVLTARDTHSLHAYFNCCPESPDGQWVLAFVSECDDAHLGRVVAVHRGSGAQRVLADHVEVEDAHRQACQQWLAQGRYVVFQNLVGDRWQAERVELETGERQVLCKGRQIGFGQPHGDLLPLYGPHWRLGEHRDLELLDVTTGQVTAVVTVEQVRQEAPASLRQAMRPDAVSLFFGVLSPDLRRIFFKTAAPSGAGFRHPKASARDGLLVWDLAESRLLCVQPRWGHPSWHPDSRRLVNVGPTWLDTTNAATAPLGRLPACKGHPSVSTDGRWFVSDMALADAGGEPVWNIVLAGVEDGQLHVLHRAPRGGGGTHSWRIPHPHPVFSADGKRLYFNVNCGDRTVLHVAER